MIRIIGSITMLSFSAFLVVSAYNMRRTWKGLPFRDLLLECSLGEADITTRMLRLECGHLWVYMFFNFAVSYSAVLYVFSLPDAMDYLQHQHLLIVSAIGLFCPLLLVPIVGTLVIMYSVLIIQVKNLDTVAAQLEQLDLGYGDTSTHFSPDSSQSISFERYHDALKTYRRVCAAHAQCSLIWGKSWLWGLIGICSGTIWLHLVVLAYMDGLLCIPESRQAVFIPAAFCGSLFWAFLLVSSFYSLLVIDSGHRELIQLVGYTYVGDGHSTIPMLFSQLQRDAGTLSAWLIDLKFTNVTPLVTPLACIWIVISLYALHGGGRGNTPRCNNASGFPALLGQGLSI